MKHMHGDQGFIQCLTEVIAVAGEPLQRHRAHGVENHLICLAGQQILVLREIVPEGDHRLAAGFELFNGGRDFQAFADAC